MGILDWFKSRPAQSDLGHQADEDLLKALDKAVTLVNPRLKLVPVYRDVMIPAVKVCVSALREMVLALPEAVPVSGAHWASSPELRAYFVAASDVTAVLAHSSNLRTLFDKFPTLDEAFFILGMGFQEQRATVLALQGNLAQGESSKTVISFSDHQARICGQNDAEVRHLLGTRVFEYLVAQALTDIGEGRSERRELADSRSLIQARLRLLRQQGPGLGSVLGMAPESVGEQRRLEAELLENERQMEALGSLQSALEADLEILRDVLAHPERYVQVERKHFRIDSMNVVQDEKSSDPGAEIVFSLAQLSGSPSLRRAFVLGRVGRADLPIVKMNLDKMSSYL